MLQPKELWSKSRNLVLAVNRRQKAKLTLHLNKCALQSVGRCLLRENIVGACCSDQYESGPIGNPVAAEMKGKEQIETTVCSLLQVFRLPVAKLHLGRPAMRASQQDFENALNQVKLLKKDPGNEVKLRLYALYKQVIA